MVLLFDYRTFDFDRIHFVLEFNKGRMMFYIKTMNKKCDETTQSAHRNDTSHQLYNEQWLGFISIRWFGSQVTNMKNCSWLEVFIEIVCVRRHKKWTSKSYTPQVHHIICEYMTTWNSRHDCQTVSAATTNPKYSSRMLWWSFRIFECTHSNNPLAQNDPVEPILIRMLTTKIQEIKPTQYLHIFVGFSNYTHTHTNEHRQTTQHRTHLDYMQWIRICK